MDPEVRADPNDTNRPASARLRSGVPLIFLAFALTLGTVLLLPTIVGRNPESTGPPVVLMLGVGSVVALITGAMMYVVVGRTLGLGRATALYAVGYNILVVGVKFVVSPLGVYDANQSQALEAMMPFSEGIGAVATGALVLGLYAAAYGLIYRLVRGRVERKANISRTLIVLLVVGTIMMAAGGGWVIAFVSLESAATYLDLLFSSAISLVTGLALAVATVLVTMCFREAKKRSQIVGDASLLASVFWLGLAVLALYHVLWVVYILVVTSLWPLRVVMPK